MIIVEHNCDPQMMEQMLELMRREGYRLWHDNRQDFFFVCEEAVPVSNFWRMRTLLPRRQAAEFERSESRDRQRLEDLIVLIERNEKHKAYWLLEDLAETIEGQEQLLSWRSRLKAEVGLC